MPQQLNLFSNNAVAGKAFGSYLVYGELFRTFLYLDVVNTFLMILYSIVESPQCQNLGGGAKDPSQESNLVKRHFMELSKR